MPGQAASLTRCRCAARAPRCDRDTGAGLPALWPAAEQCCKPTEPTIAQPQCCGGKGGGQRGGWREGKVHQLKRISVWRQHDPQTVKRIGSVHLEAVQVRQQMLHAHGAALTIGRHLSLLFYCPLCALHAFRCLHMPQTPHDLKRSGPLSLTGCHFIVLLLSSAPGPSVQFSGRGSCAPILLQ